MSFFTFIFALYFLMHLFVIYRSAAQLNVKIKLFHWILPAMFLSLSPLFARYIPESWPYGFIVAFNAMAYWWFGTLFYFILWQLLLYIPEAILKPFKIINSGFFRTPKLFILACSLTILTVGYGYYEGKTLKPEYHAIKTSKIKMKTRLIALSDIHLGALFKADRLKPVLDKVNANNPDIVLFLGDLLNDNTSRLQTEAELIRGLKTTKGVFGIFGNHEFYIPPGEAERFFRDAKIRHISSDFVYFPESNLQILGLDDPGIPRGRGKDVALERLTALKPFINGHAFSVLMHHRPWWWEEKASGMGIDLQLSGHTHAGQLFPFGYVVKLEQKFLKGLFQKGESRLVVSNGAGFWGPPFRVLTPPDMLVIDLLPE